MAEDSEEEEEPEQKQEEQSPAPAPSPPSPRAQKPAKKKAKREKGADASAAEMAVDSSDAPMSEALVPVDPNAALAETPTPVRVVPGPRSPHRETWGAMPEEAKRPWKVSGETCTLEVGGNVLKLPRGIYDRLFVYQRQGVAWLWNLYQKKFGGILADEMGLGKTVQIAAFLACLKCTNEGSRFLVVV